MPNSLSIGLKSSEKYSSISLITIGEVFIGKTVVKSHTGFREFHDPKHPPSFYEEAGRNFVAFLNDEIGAALPLNKENKNFKDEDQRLAFTYKILKRAVEIISAKYFDEITAFDQEEDNDVTNITDVVSKLNQLDDKLEKTTPYEIGLTDLLPTTLPPEIDPTDLLNNLNLFERQCALTVIKQLFNSAKLSRNGVAGAIDTYQKLTDSEAITNVTIDYLNNFYWNPLETLILKFNDQTVHEIEQDIIYDKYSEIFDEIDSFFVFIDMFSGHLDKFIYEWIKTLILDSNNEPIDTEEHKKHTNELIKFRSETLAWLDFIRRFNDELKQFNEDIQAMIAEISTFNDSEEANPILKELIDLEQIILEKNEHFKTFARVYVDCAILFHHEDSKRTVYDENFKKSLETAKRLNELFDHASSIMDEHNNMLAKLEYETVGMKAENHLHFNSLEDIPRLQSNCQEIVKKSQEFSNTLKNIRATLTAVEPLIGKIPSDKFYDREINTLENCEFEDMKLYEPNFEPVKETDPETQETVEVEIEVEKIASAEEIILGKFFSAVEYYESESRKALDIQLCQFMQEYEFLLKLWPKASPTANRYARFLSIPQPISVGSSKDNPLPQSLSSLPQAPTPVVYKDGKEEKSDDEKDNIPPFMA